MREIGCIFVKNNFNMEEDKLEYWQKLNEEYSVSLPNKSFEEASEDEIYKWFLKGREQSKQLIDNYGESAWNIHRFMELCRGEDISESFFRQLVRYEIDKECKKYGNK